MYSSKKRLSRGSGRKRFSKSSFKKRVIKKKSNRNRRVIRSKNRRNRLKRSKNKRRVRRRHRGGFVEVGSSLENFQGAALPCFSAGSDPSEIMNSIANYEGKKVDEINFKEGKFKTMLDKIQKKGGPKWSPEGEKELEYGLSKCGNKPGSIDLNECPYKKDGKCSSEFANFAEASSYDITAEL